MGLLEKLKSVFGSGDGRQSSPKTGQPDVTVEHEPAAESEHVVKGTEPAETVASDDGDEHAEPDSPPVDEIRGIGPTYSTRLSQIGVETVADLETADPEEVAEAAGTSTSRAEGWIQRARDQ